MCIQRQARAIKRGGQLQRRKQQETPLQALPSCYQQQLFRMEASKRAKGYLEDERVHAHYVMPIASYNSLISIRGRPSILPDSICSSKGFG